MSAASQQVSRLLGELITINRRMEVLMEKVEENTKKEERTGEGGTEVQSTTVSASQDMMTYLKNLDDKATKTNELLETLVGKFDGIATGGDTSTSGGESLADTGKGIYSIIRSAWAFTALPKKTQKDFIDFIRDVIMAVAGKDTSGKELLSPEEMDSLGTLLKSVGDVLEVFTKNVISTAVKLRLARSLNIPEQIGDLISRIVDSVKVSETPKGTEEKIKAVGDVLKMIDSISIMLPLKLILAAPLWIGAAVAMVPMMIVVGSLQMFFNWLGSKTTAENVENGTKAIKGIGMGLAVLGLAVFGFGALITMLGVEKLAASLITIGAISLAFFVIGKGEAEIAKGATAVGMIALSIAGLGLGVWVFTGFMNKAGREMGMSTLLAGLAAVGIVAALGFAYYAIGNFAARIAMGALAVAAIGLSIGILGWGINMFFTSMTDTVAMGEEKGFMALAKATAIGVGAVVGFGLAFFLIGNFVAPIALGALAAVAIGLGLAAFGWGLSKAYENFAKIPEGGVVEIGLAIGSLAIEFALIGNPFTLVPLYAGIGAVTAMGLALWSVSKGLVAFNENTKNLDFGDPETDINNPDTLIGKVYAATVGIAKAFAAVGDEGGGRSGGLLGLLTGIKLGPNNVETGILSVLKANQALTSVAQGLLNFQTLIAQIKSVDGTTGIGNFDEADPGQSTGLIGDVYNSVSMVSKAFAAIGQSGNTGTSLTKMLFGNDFKKSDTEVGIDSVLNAGRALTSVAEGLLNFQKMTKEFSGQADAFKLEISETTVGEATYRTASGSGLLANIFNTVSAVQQAFAAIGSQGEGTSYLKILTGADFGSTPTEKGIASVRDLGKVLSGVAEGMVAFSQVSGSGIPVINGYDKNGKPIFDKTQKITLQQVIDGIRKVFSDTEGILVPFKELGMQEDFTSGFLGLGGGEPKGPIGKGVKALQGIGPTLSGITDILKMFTQKEGPNVAAAAKGIDDMVNAILRSFTGEIDGTSKEDLFYLLGEIFTNEDVVDGMKNYQKITQGLLGLSGQGGGGITKVYTEVNAAVNLVGANQNFKKFADVIKSLAGIATPFEKFTKSFTKFSQDMGVFKANFSVMNKDGIMAFKQWSDSIVNVSKVEVNKSEGIVGFINDTVSAAFGAGRDATMGNKPPQEFTAAEKGKAVQNATAPPAPATKPAETKSSAMDAQVIATAVKQALQNVTIRSLSVDGDLYVKGDVKPF